jgi:hypothetical protein
MIPQLENTHTNTYPKRCSLCYGNQRCFTFQLTRTRNNKSNELAKNVSYDREMNVRPWISETLFLAAGSGLPDGIPTYICIHLLYFGKPWDWLFCCILCRFGVFWQLVYLWPFLNILPTWVCWAWVGTHGDKCGSPAHDVAQRLVFKSPSHHKNA